MEEANNAGIYCAAHAYTDVAVARAVRCGITSIEHGNYASRATLRALGDAGGFLVPTLAGTSTRSFRSFIHSFVRSSTCHSLVRSFVSFIHSRST